MKNLDFYQIIDAEIDALNNIFKNNTFLKKQNPTGKKSFGFLLWFLKNYAPKKNLPELEQYITEGDDDTSCDLIFDNVDQQGESIYYVVQAKWFAQGNISKSNETTKEIKACLSDFRLVLSGRKSPSEINIKFNERYQKFLEHKKSNGKIKFLFVALCKIDAIKTEEHIKDFSTKLVKFELMDLNVLKKLYVELVYKGIVTHNPIEIPYVPETKFRLNFVKSNYITISQPLPHEAYILLIKPAEIHSLFEEYGFSLFYKNIRNPLPKSYFNEKLVETIKKNPLYFWYFNNGITAISNKIYDFHTDSDYLEIKGIQVINGAQTVYGIYDAYHKATDADREIMDDNALITLRLLKTGGQDFDLKVTRYTNSQNPINERDFHANDDIQKKLQTEFLDNTNIWYETRRGEFRKKHKNAIVVTNELLGQTYLAYKLQDPFDAKQNKKLIFQSNRIFSNGLYELIFNDHTNYEDIYISYHLYNYIERRRSLFRREINKIKNDETLTVEQRTLLLYNFVQYSTFDILALFQVTLATINNPNLKSVNGKLISDFEKSSYVICSKYYEFIVEAVKKFIINEQDNDPKLVFSVWFKTKGNYLKLKAYLSEILNDKSLKVEELMLT